MIDFEKEFERPDCELGYRETAVAATFRRVYGWMCAGLALSGAVAWYTATSGLWHTILTGGGMMVCVLVELALVWILSASINRLPTLAASLMFLAYAAVNGLTLSVVFIAYELALVQRVFFITAGMFGGLAVWGTVTKGNLSGIGSICGMGLWGVVIASVVNLFMRSSGLDWAISFVGILVFTGLTMYDAQRIRQMADAERGMARDVAQKAGIMGALALYLDFINLFLMILRFMGRRR